MKILKLYLIGFRGSGKTTIGKILANRLNVNFVDTDEEIVKRTGMSIPEIFSRFGKKEFREMEKDVLKELSECKRSMVVATGGGIVLSEENRKILRETGLCVWLKVSPEESLKRISGDPNRPPLTSLPPDEEVRELIKKRTPMYAEASHLCIDTTVFCPDEAVKIIVSVISILGLSG